MTEGTTVSPWTNININDVLEEASPTKGNFEPVPAGSYTLQILGAEPSKFQEGAINISTAIADEGQFNGRRIFIDLPNPLKQTWAPSVLQRMVNAMGATMEAYADPIETLNSLANNGHSRFLADVYIKEYKKKTDVPDPVSGVVTPTGKKNAINYRSIRPSA